MHPTVHGSDGKDAKMRLKIRYENEYQSITLDAEATEELWAVLSRTAVEHEDLQLLFHW